jgi:elongator complex protein 1
VKVHLFDGKFQQLILFQQEVCRIYGDYLLSKKYFEDSALIYERGGMMDKAVDSWEKAVCPSYCLSAAKTLGLSPNEMSSLCRRLVESLTDGKRHLEASHLLLEYLDDVEEAVATLVSGNLWSEAQRLIVKHSRKDLLRKNETFSL